MCNGPNDSTPGDNIGDGGNTGDFLRVMQTETPPSKIVEPCGQDRLKEEKALWGLHGWYPLFLAILMLHGLSESQFKAFDRLTI